MGVGVVYPVSATDWSSCGCSPKSAKVEVGASVLGAADVLESVIRMGRCRGNEKEQNEYAAKPGLLWITLF
jgi:hypothetical protein